jgi:hypothetical protein
MTRHTEVGRTGRCGATMISPGETERRISTSASAAKVQTVEAQEQWKSNEAERSLSVLRGPVRLPYLLTIVSISTYPLNISAFALIFLAEVTDNRAEG